MGPYLSHSVLQILLVLARTLPRSSPPILVPLSCWKCQKLTFLSLHLLLGLRPLRLGSPPTLNCRGSNLIEVRVKGGLRVRIRIMFPPIICLLCGGGYSKVENLRSYSRLPLLFFPIVRGLI